MQIEQQQNKKMHYTMHERVYRLSSKSIQAFKFQIKEERKHSLPTDSN